MSETAKEHCVWVNEKDKVASMHQPLNEPDYEKRIFLQEDHFQECMLELINAGYRFQ